MNEYLARTDTFMASLGLETYRVGGSVRDELLGRRVKDADYMVRNASLLDLRVALNAATDEADKITPLKLRTGSQGGWRLAKRGLGCVEIMLPRIDRSTGPGRHDFEIVVDPRLPLEEDAIRRDFTFNALYKPLRRELGDGDHDEVLDPTHRGLYDLSHKLINTTYYNSFRDDPLRILRALRFVSKLDYDLGTNTLEQMYEYAEAVDGLTEKGVSGTALDELCKLLMGQNPAKALRLARDTGVLETLLPELKPMLGFEQKSRYHDLTTDEHTFKTLETAAHVDAPLRVRMALLFHDSGKPEAAWEDEKGNLHYYAHRYKNPIYRMVAGTQVPENGEMPPFYLETEDHEIIGKRIARKALKRLNAGNALRHDVERLIENHMVNVVGKVKPTKVRRMRVKLGDDLLRDLYLHRLCDLSGKEKASREQMEKIGYLEQVRATAQAEGVPASVKELPLSGHDLLAMGYEGKQIGVALEMLLDEVVCQPSLNDREWLLERAKEYRDREVV